MRLSNLTDKRSNLTPDRLREALNYDSLTGIFTWQFANDGHEIGEIAGSASRSGRRTILIDGQTFYASRLAWLYVYGKWPINFLDHVDGNPGNDKIENLRDCTHAQNMANAKSVKTGLKGTYFKNGHWVAKITQNYRQQWLGYFNSEQEAHAAYQQAARKIFGEFARFK